MNGEEIYNIYSHDGCGHRDYVATTNNLDKWLEANNKERKEQGLSEESHDDFETEIAVFYMFKEKGE